MLAPSQPLFPLLITPANHCQGLRSSVAEAGHVRAFTPSLSLLSSSRISSGSVAVRDSNVARRHACSQFPERTTVKENEILSFINVPNIVGCPIAYASNRTVCDDKECDIPSQYTIVTLASRSHRASVRVSEHRMPVRRPIAFHIAARVRICIGQHQRLPSARFTDLAPHSNRPIRICLGTKNIIRTRAGRLVPYIFLAGSVKPPGCTASAWRLLPATEPRNLKSLLDQ
ncbi:hypothetical protein XA68_13650 [Ophiocordyceps unilateralis]|uniref:Uncharacterized protein n=1 Tax=Ophiocordyceps unilateralis TaxID=268505 RepID=A0A2A9PMH6_OPHUN|nr:hypothetical protein XA68_13650 [Ophiocordyceps unilateralis]